MAVRICLAGSPPLCSFIGTRDDRRPSAPAALLRYRRPPPCGVLAVASTEPVSESGGGWAGLRTRAGRKSVAFADSWGLALTTVHVFSEADDDLQPQLSGAGGAAAQLGGVPDGSGSGSGLVLDFPPPAEDYLDLRSRLQTQQVCLETCWVQDRLLSGTVQVRNICFEKSVLVRITFDSWRSFRDVDCRYLNTVYSGPDTDTFCFSVGVPDLDRSDRVEFCIRYQTQDQTFWDNNLGLNYRLADPNRVPESASGSEVQKDRGGTKVDLDPFGSPRTSSGVFPEYQSCGSVETGAPYW